MPADSGTVTLASDTRHGKLRCLEIVWLTGAGVATFEKTLVGSFSGRIVQLAAKPGATPPTAVSDLAIFDERDTSQADALITAAADGLDLITTAFKKKVVAAPQPVVAGSLRLQVTGNAVNNATGTIYIWLQEPDRP